MKAINNIEEMLTFLKRSKEGERAVYYTGFLLADRQNYDTYNRRKEQIKICDLAYRAYEQSLCTLVQKKKREDKYEYIIESFGLGRSLGFGS